MKEPFATRGQYTTCIKLLSIKSVGLWLSLCYRDLCPLSQNRRCILYTLIHALSMHQRYKYGQAFHPPPCQLRHLIRVPYTHTTQSHVVLRPGLTGILAFPQSAGAPWQSDVNRLQSLTFSLHQLVMLEPFLWPFWLRRVCAQQLAGSRTFINTN